MRWEIKQLKIDPFLLSITPAGALTGDDNPKEEADKDKTKPDNEADKKETDDTRKNNITQFDALVITEIQKLCAQMRSVFNFSSLINDKNRAHVYKMATISNDGDLSEYLTYSIKTRPSAEAATAPPPATAHWHEVFTPRKVTKAAEKKIFLYRRMLLRLAQLADTNLNRAVAHTDSNINDHTNQFNNSINEILTEFIIQARQILKVDIIKGGASYAPFLIYAPIFLFFVLFTFLYEAKTNEENQIVRFFVYNFLRITDIGLIENHFNIYFNLLVIYIPFCIMSCLCSIYIRTNPTTIQELIESAQVKVGARIVVCVLYSLPLAMLLNFGIIKPEAIIGFSLKGFFTIQISLYYMWLHHWLYRISPSLTCRKNGIQ